jgi:hypothetical protein
MVMHSSAGFPDLGQMLQTCCAGVVQCSELMATSGPRHVGVLNQQGWLEPGRIALIAMGHRQLVLHGAVAVAVQGTTLACDMFSRNFTKCVLWQLKASVVHCQL